MQGRTLKNANVRTRRKNGNHSGGNRSNKRERNVEMSKINTDAITGFADMSAEEKLDALLNYEFEAPKQDTAEVEKLKASLSKANSEAAEWKRALREKQTEAERVEAERAEREAQKDALLKQLQDERRVTVYKSRFMEAGVDPATADVMAKSLPDGVGDEYFDAYKSFIDTRTKEIESAVLSKQPGLSVGAPPTSKQAEQDAINQRRSYMGLPPIKT